MNKRKSRRIKNVAIKEAHEKGYKVLDNGDVLSPKGKIRKLHLIHGYYHFTIKYKQKYVIIPVHMLMAYQKFGIKIFRHKYEVRHLNGVSTDNSLENIAIGTSSDNERDKSPEYLKRHTDKMNKPRRKLSDGQVREIRMDKENGMTYNDLVEKYKICRSSIFDIVHRNSYKDVE